MKSAHQHYALNEAAYIFLQSNWLSTSQGKRGVSIFSIDIDINCTSSITFQKRFRELPPDEIYTMIEQCNDKSNKVLHLS